MKLTKLLILPICLVMFFACQPATKTADEGNSGEKAKENADKTALSVTGRPETIKQKQKERGEQETAEIELSVVSPKEGETINSSTVKVNVKVGGPLKRGKLEDGTGNHVHVILDNQPYAAHYDWNEGFELRNVSDGEHTLRMFASRPWHEATKMKRHLRL